MATIQIQRSTLKAASHFMAQKDIRYYLNGILIESSPIETRACATDGHAMLLRQEDRKDDNAGSAGIIMPAETVAMILKWKAPHKSAADMPIVITVPDDAAAEHRAEWCGQIAVFRPVEGKFPDYTRVIPQSVSGLAGHYNPDYLARCKAAAVDLGAPKMYGINLAQNGDAPALVTFNSQAFAIVMPMRGEPGDIGAAEWARTKITDQVAD